MLTSYERRYRQPVLDLLFHHTRVHQHLDWQEVSDWLDSEQFTMRLRWENEQLMALMATAAPLQQTTWVRLAALRDNISGQVMLGELWHELSGVLRAEGVHTAGVLVTNEWFSRYLPGLGFHYEEHVITLQRSGHFLPDGPLHPVEIRSALYDDLASMCAVDNAAFKPSWQLSLSDLRYAYRISALCTVAVWQNAIIGYQLSTQYRANGHLARLAVSPIMQGQGVGAALVNDMVRRFWEREVDVVTVNTQASNYRSQQLYLHYGFRRNGYDLPVWKMTM